MAYNLKLPMDISSGFRIAGNLKDPYCVHIWFWGRKFHGWTGIHFNRMILAIAGAGESLVCKL